ncbi:hypothetical protein BC829DRAFT_265307 [Chytridium lagenaria]|nr:hypothetical protein BC829DRAFT_265307 [Chytridium lagenaria]
MDIRISFACPTPLCVTSVTNLTSTRSIAPHPNLTSGPTSTATPPKTSSLLPIPGSTPYHPFTSNAHSAALSLSSVDYPSRAWASRAFARIPALNVFAPDAPVDAATVPLNMVKPVNADGLLEGMLYGDWPMNVWKAAAVRMAGGKSGSGSVKAGFGFVVAAIVVGVVALL